MIYRLLLGTLTFNYPVNKELELIFKECMYAGISEIENKNSYYLTIIFNNGISIKTWNSNRFYAWMSQGEIFNLIDNKKIYSWVDYRPSAKTMYKILNFLKKGNNNIDLGTVHVFETIQKSSDLNKVYSEIKKMSYEQKNITNNN